MPHPPLLLPGVGLEKDKEEVKKTITKMKNLGDIFADKKIDKIIISSPHPDWGFNVPLYFLSQEKVLDYHTLKNVNIEKSKIVPIITSSFSPKKHFLLGQNFYNKHIKEKNINFALIASGDLSHRLKEDGPYGFHHDGKNFDKQIISSIKEKNIKNMLTLEEKYPSAGECGLRSISFLFGILESYKKNTNKDYFPKIISYEAPFGVGYLITQFIFKKQ